MRHAFTLRLPGVHFDRNCRSPSPKGDSANNSQDAREGRCSGERLQHDPIHRGKIVRYHEDVLNQLDTTRTSLVTANQVHGSRVVVVRTRPRLPISETDGLLTQSRGLPLGVYVADCCAVYLADRKTPAIGLLHAGKRGTQANIAGAAIGSMQRAFGTEPGNVLAVLSPCIRPCHYEMDIPAAIERQLRDAGVADVVNTGVCTACDTEQFYSYRAEKGDTGRMLAVLMLR